MKVLEIGTLNVNKGGPPFSLSRQMYGLRENGIDSVCFMPPCNVEDLIDQSLYYHFSEPPTFKLLGFDYIPHIEDSVSDVKDVDIIHIQAVWTFFPYAVANYANRIGMPYVIAPRGSLYKRAMGDRKWLKKRIAWYVYQKRVMNQASCIQATCTDEMKELRAIGCKKPIAVIPNSYDAEIITKGGYNNDGLFRIGYLGRLSPRKHVEMIIYSLAELKKQYDDVRLLIIGQDDKEYEFFLRSECDRLKLNNYVEFTGFLKGEALDKAIRRCNIFAFPSNFENWGNVVPDVLVREIPAIASKGMPWEVLNEKKCGWWIDSDQTTLNRTLIQAYKLGKSELMQMGIRGRLVVEENYSVKAIGYMLKELYTWILNGGNKPEFVYL